MKYEIPNNNTGWPKKNVRFCPILFQDLITALVIDILAQNFQR